MYGASIETDFQHIAFENEQLKRKLETRRLIDAECRTQVSRRRSLAEIFGRIVSELYPRVRGGNPRQRPQAPFSA